jgi:hypothetical protein
MVERFPKLEISPYHGKIPSKLGISPEKRYLLFPTVPDSRIISWESWFIFNLRKINTNQYYESGSLDAGNCNAIHDITRRQMHIITVHT